MTSKDQAASIQCNIQYYEQVDRNILTWPHSRDIMVFTKARKVLIEFFNPIAMRFRSNLRCLLNLQLGQLFMVPAKQIKHVLDVLTSEYLVDFAKVVNIS